MKTSLVIAVVNQKGGVGKTTTTVNLGTALAASGRRVMIVDVDPQGNASTSLGIDYGQRTHGTYSLLLPQGTEPASRETLVPNLTILSADSELAGAEIELVNESRREYRLSEGLERWGFLNKHDIILLDCPPSLGLLTLNSLVACDEVLVPLQCEFFALEGVSQLLRTIDRVRASLNTGLTLNGIVLTMFDRRNNLSELVAADARSFFRDLVYDTVIPRNVRVSEAPSHGKPVLLYDYRSPGAQAYVKLAQEFMTRRRRNIKASA